MHGVIADSGLLDVNGTLIAEVIAFLLMVLLLGKFVYPRVIKAATEREGKIEAGLRAADEAEKRLRDVQQQVQQTLDEARAQAREIINRAHTDATVEAEEVRRNARAEGDGLIQRARTDISAERDRAIQDLRSEVSNLVVQATAELIGVVLDRKEHDRLIEEALNKVGDAQVATSRSN